MKLLTLAPNILWRAMQAQHFGKIPPFFLRNQTSWGYLRPLGWNFPLRALHCNQTERCEPISSVIQIHIVQHEIKSNLYTRHIHQLHVSIWYQYCQLWYLVTQKLYPFFLGPSYLPITYNFISLFRAHSTVSQSRYSNTFTPQSTFFQPIFNPDWVSSRYTIRFYLYHDKKSVEMWYAYTSKSIFH